MATADLINTAINYALTILVLVAALGLGYIIGYVEAGTRHLDKDRSRQ